MFLPFFSVPQVESDVADVFKYYKSHSIRRPIWNTTQKVTINGTKSRFSHPAKWTFKNNI